MAPLAPLATPMVSPDWTTFYQLGEKRLAFIFFLRKTGFPSKV